MNEELRAKLDLLPDEPGVYIWKDGEGKPLYVGKAKNLRVRTRWYFGPDADEDPRLRLLRMRARDVETIVVQSEAQALLLENNLIKEHQPRFNVNLRDDKRYPWLAVTVQEDFPRILVTRQAADDGARYFGPYTDVGGLRRTLRIIRRLFTVRSCGYDLPGDAPDRPCLDHHIGKCLAPCVGLETLEHYRGMIQDVLLFLEGRTVEVRTRLRERMKAAADAQDYEGAAELRDVLLRLDQIDERPTVEHVGGGDCDAVGLARDEDDACAVVMRIRDGKVIGREHTFLEHASLATEGEILTSYLVQYYLPRPWRARTAVLSYPPADEDALRETFAPAQFRIPSGGRFKRLVELADQNARHLLETLRLETFEGAERAEDPVYALGRDLGLATVPRSLVCADISTSHGRDTVGSIVWFENARPKRSEYRTYRMRTVEGVDDFASMREMVTRFFTRRIAEGKVLPDLFVVDGGRGQLGAALAAARDTKVPEALPFIGLAKREEEIYLPDRSEPLRLPRRNESLRLLQRARDEAHRVAVTFNRKSRSARTITSALLEIPGVGPSRRRALLEKFGSLAGVKSATMEELKGVDGISQKMAQKIFEAVHRD